MREKEINYQNDSISLKELVLQFREWRKYLISKWVVILTVAAIGGALGLAYAFTQKPLYIADLTFVLEEGQSSGGGLGAYSDIASMVGVDLGGGAGGVFSGDNIMEFMKSRSMIEKTLLSTVTINGRNQTLAEYYIEINKFRENWDSEPKLKNIHFLPTVERTKFTRKQDSILAVFYNKILKTSLSVGKKDKKLGIISVAVITPDELFSKYFAETLVSVVSNFYIQTKTKKSVHNLNILKKQTDSVRRALHSAITGAAASIDVNPNPNPALQILRVPSQTRQVDVQTNSAILQSLVPNLEMARITFRKEMPLIQEIDRPILPLKKEIGLGKLKGLVSGLILGAFIAIFYVVFKKVSNQIMA